jgi:hypothetical protein
MDQHDQAIRTGLHRVWHMSGVGGMINESGNDVEMTYVQ